MIRFALVVASVLGFVLTAALGNMMVPLLRELQRAARGTQPDSDAPDSPAFPAQALLFCALRAG